MKCPVCDLPLTMAERSGIEIDYCPKCRGVWLDRGELDKIIERSQAAMAPPPVPQAPGPGYRQEHKHEYKQDSKYYKKKNLLGEIFDF